MEMVCRQRYHKVQAFPPECAQQPLTHRIRLGTLRWRLQHAQAQVAYAPVQGLGENAVAVMDEEAVAVIRRYRFAQLLEGPLRRGMRRDVDMEQSATGVFNDHKDVEQTKRCSDHDAEITGHDRLGMIA